MNSGRAKPNDRRVLIKSFAVTLILLLSIGVQTSWMKEVSNPSSQIVSSPVEEYAPSYGGSWLDPWEFRQRHTIQSSLGSDPIPDYQIHITVHFGSGSSGASEHVYLNGYCEPDFSDIRFTDDDGITLLDHWRESSVSGDYATYWVEVKDDLGGGDQEVYIYYGNDQAATASDGDATFPFFDDFSFLDVGKWAVTEYGAGTETHSYDVSGGELHVHAESNSVSSGYRFDTIQTFANTDFHLTIKGRWANLDWSRGGGNFQTLELIDAESQSTGIIVRLRGSNWLTTFRYLDGSWTDLYQPEYSAGNTEFNCFVSDSTSFDMELTETLSLSYAGTVSGFHYPFSIRLWA
ncbi:MAG: DUF2341 domain-containing protein, partial [Candidatus Thorarchaeota archaeon]